MLIVSLLLWIFIYNQQLLRWEGTIFLILLVLYTLAILKFSGKNINPKKHFTTKKRLALGWTIIMLVLSYVGLAAGSKLLVYNASIIATNFGVSERVIAITVVAFGTSLPELTTSLLAALKGEMDISIGNIIGSNIYNILAVLGLVGVIRPIPVDIRFLNFDIFWMFGTSLCLFLFILPFKGGKLTRMKGAVLFISYLIYIYLLYSDKL
jgi:cation:H+ antiporter